MLTRDLPREITLLRYEDGSRGTEPAHYTNMKSTPRRVWRKKDVFNEDDDAPIMPSPTRVAGTYQPPEEVPVPKKRRMSRRSLMPAEIPRPTRVAGSYRPAEPADSASTSSSEALPATTANTMGRKTIRVAFPSTNTWIETWSDGELEAFAQACFPSHKFTVCSSMPYTVPISEVLEEIKDATKRAKIQDVTRPDVDFRGKDRAECVAILKTLRSITRGREVRMATYMKNGIPTGFQKIPVLQMQYREMQITSYRDVFYVIPSKYSRTERAMITAPGWYADITFDGVEENELKFAFRLVWIEDHSWR
jgi:hypothetical protein